jgi:hypothetical protein
MNEWHEVDDTTKRESGEPKNAQRERRANGRNEGTVTGRKEVGYRPASTWTETNHFRLHLQANQNLLPI